MWCDDTVGMWGIVQTETLQSLIWQVPQSLRDKLSNSGFTDEIILGAETRYLNE